MGRRNGERVAITLDSKGKASLVEHYSTAPETALPTQQMGFTTQTMDEAPETTRSAEIADYIQRLGMLPIYSPLVLY